MREKIDAHYCTLWFVNTISGTTRVCLIRTGSAVKRSHSSTMLFYVVGCSFLITYDAPGACCC